jgi:hypothetical protein
MFLSLYELILIGSTEVHIVHCTALCLFQNFFILFLLIVANILYFQCLKLNSNPLAYDIDAVVLS